MQFIAFLALAAGVIAAPNYAPPPPRNYPVPTHSAQGYPQPSDGAHSGSHNNGGNGNGHGSGNGNNGHGGHGKQQYQCPAGLYSNAQCCATDVLGVADLDCRAPNSVPTSAQNFKHICASSGKVAKCCVIPVAGQDVLCVDPVGI